MRIAYVAHYQGKTLLKHRPSLDNLSLAMKVKVELIAALLRKNSHDIELLSQGEVDRYQYKYYPPLIEEEPFDPSVPIFYASALPIKFINGFWSGNRTINLLKTRHKVKPFDLVLIHNMKRAHLICADYAMHRMGLPVILDYEDDSFVDVAGRREKGMGQTYHHKLCRKALRQVSGCMGVSPYLLDQARSGIPKLLLRGVVSEKIAQLNGEPPANRKNWVVFSGTHEGTQGLLQMIEAWNKLAIPDWELHIAGKGPITAKMEQLAGNNRSIVFHGFLKMEDNAKLLCAAKIGMNAQDPTQTPGNVFAFKIIEYLAAGLHVITTPRGAVEPELEKGITYIPDNTSDTIAKSIKTAIQSRLYEQNAIQATLKNYGPVSVAAALNQLVQKAITLRPG